MERRSPAVVDWPIRVADIEALIERSAPGEITADVIGNNVGADTRGLTAMRWVLDHDDVAELLGRRALVRLPARQRRGDRVRGRT